MKRVIASFILGVGILVSLVGVVFVGYAPFIWSSHVLWAGVFNVAVYLVYILGLSFGVALVVWGWKLLAHCACKGYGLITKLPAIVLLALIGDLVYVCVKYYL